MNAFSITFTIVILSFALWLVWPAIRRRPARNAREAGTMETEIPRKTLEKELDALYDAASAYPSLTNDIGWLSKRERIWAQLNYHNLCDQLNRMSASEDSDERY